MNLEDKIKHWKQEEAFAFKGWNFSHIKGRWESELLPWDYESIVKKYLRYDSNLLDMGTGGGEFLFSLNHDNSLTAVTEGYLPNYNLCKDTLEPLGVRVEFVKDDDVLNFKDEKFDVVLNRHETFSVDEVYRVLKSGGIFITQQIGGENDIDLSRRLINDFEPMFLENSLDKMVPKMVNKGFEILYKEEVFTPIKFFDTGALVYFAKIIEWEFTGFSVERYKDKLVEVDNEISKNGYIEGTEHRYIVVARKL